MSRWCALLLIPFAAACGSASSGSSTGDERDVTAAQATCAAKRDADLKKDESTNGMIQAELGYADCVGKQNDATIAKIEAKLNTPGVVQKAAKDYRAASGPLCGSGADGGDSGGGTLSHVEAAACDGIRERDLARIMAAHFDFGKPPFVVPSGRDQFPKCYQAFDAQVKKDDIRVATDALNVCLRDGIGGLVPGLKSATVEAFPDRKPDEVEKSIKDAIQAAETSGDAFCGAIDPGLQTSDTANLLGCTTDSLVQIAREVSLNLK